MIISRIFCQKKICNIVQRDFIYDMINSSRKKGYRHLFILTIKYLTNTDIPARLSHCLRSASIF